MIAFILVGYGHQELEKSCRTLMPLVDRYRAKLLVIDTSRDETFLDGRHINEAFEFSGYQYGIDSLCDEVTANGSPTQAATHIKVIVLNGTAFSSHLKCITRKFVEFMIRVADQPITKPMAVGLRWEAHGAIRDIAKRGYYIATFLFGLTATVGELRRCRFYDPTIVGQKPFAHFRTSLSKGYNELIDEWLSPTRFFGGWYKASPFRQTDSSVLYRKQLAIYFEHTLPVRLAAAGFSLVSTNVNGPFFIRLQFVALLIVDRIYVNLLKLWHRLGSSILS
jgi:hypothetical protein